MITSKQKEQKTNSQSDQKDPDTRRQLENAMIDVSKNGSKGQENSRGIECIH
jgi:hypothetical protein